MSAPDPMPGLAAVPGLAPEEEEHLHVLLVEDDEGDAVLVQELLAERPIEWRWARSLADAGRMYGPPVSCVLLDLGLPDGVGLEALDAMLAIAPDAPVVVLTGRDDASAGSRAVALGAQDYLAKSSVDAETLLRSIRYAVDRRRGERDAARLRHAELTQAENQRLERGLLPRPLITSKELRWATRYAPGSDQALLGGDFFDAVELPDGTVRVVVGDVCGHGPDEAALGVALRVAWRTLVLAGTRPEVVLPRLERVLEAERHAGHVFTTACDLVVDPVANQAEVRLAGHPGPFRLGPDCVGEQVLERRGPLLGVFPDASWEASTVELGPQWTLMLYTDGLIEGRDGTDDGRFDVAGLTDLARDVVGDADRLGELADRLVAGAEDANGGPLLDDVALFLLSNESRWPG